MNGSGLPDESSFNYDQARLNSPLNQLIREYISTLPDSFYQPEQVVGLQKVIDDYISENPDTLKDQLHPVLLNAIDDYVDANPGVQDGDLITIDEPALPGYSACVKSDCVQTDAKGNFSLPNPSGASRASIKITDPNADNPALAMRYINDWKGPVVVKAYTVAADPQTLSRLTTIPGCDADLAALVCKLDGATLQLRDQHLNDTSIIPIGDGITIAGGKQNEVGLMQGFLTLPFVSEQVSGSPFIIGYFDIIGRRLFTDTFQFYDSRDGICLSYDGKYNQQGDLYTLKTGCEDSHPGYDYIINRGDLIISGVPTSVVFNTTTQPEEPELRINTWFNGPNSPEDKYANAYGHLDVMLVQKDDKIYRGQIVGLGGSSNMHPPTPLLHYDLSHAIPEGWWYLDLYRYTVELNPLWNNFWGSDVTFWTSDNNPQFPMVLFTNK
jgi:hypothetical protein